MSHIHIIRIMLIVACICHHMLPRRIVFIVVSFICLFSSSIFARSHHALCCQCGFASKRHHVYYCVITRIMFIVVSWMHSYALWSMLSTYSLKTYHAFCWFLNVHAIIRIILIDVRPRIFFHDASCSLLCIACACTSLGIVVRRR